MLLGPDARHVDDGGTLARCRAPERGVSADAKCLMPVADNRVMDRCARRRREAESQHVALDLDIAYGLSVRASSSSSCLHISYRPKKRLSRQRESKPTEAQSQPSLLMGTSGDRRVTGADG
jgi:hypothetical protein